MSDNVQLFMNVKEQSMTGQRSDDLWMGKLKVKDKTMDTFSLKILIAQPLGAG